MAVVVGMKVTLQCQGQPGPLGEAERRYGIGELAAQNSKVAGYTFGSDTKFVFEY